MSKAEYSYVFEVETRVNIGSNVTRTVVAGSAIEAIEMVWQQSDVDEPIIESVERIERAMLKPKDEADNE